MLNIIGKGGMAREVGLYYNSYPVKYGEFTEIDEFDTKTDTVIAIGDGNIRKVLAEKYPNFNYVSLFFGTIHQPKKLAHVQGCIFCPGSRLTMDIQIGKHVIINNNATIAHDCVLGDYVTVAPGANISGNVTIGNLCYIGTGAVIIEKITICDDVTIGAGAVVIRDITEPGVYVGNPCKKIK